MHDLSMHVTNIKDFIVYLKVFLIIQSSSLVTRLAHVILTGHLPQKVSYHSHCH